MDFHLQNYFDSYVRYACLSLHIVLFWFCFLLLFHTENVNYFIYNIDWFGQLLSASEKNTEVKLNTGQTKICKLYQSQTTPVLESEWRSVLLRRAVYIGIKNSVAEFICHVNADRTFFKTNLFRTRIIEN